MKTGEKCKYLKYNLIPNLTLLIFPLFSENGKMTGLLGEVAYGIVDTSLAGFVVTKERDEFVSFSPGIFKTANRAFIRRPLDTDVSFVYYVGEFLPQTWILVLIFYFVSWISIIAALSTKFYGRNLLLNSLQIQLRAIVAMGNTVAKSKTSSKIGTFVVLLSCMIIFLHYRAELNAHLNARITTLPVNSWEEIYNQKMNVLISTGGVAEGYFSMAPKGSARRKIYKEVISKADPDQHLNGKGSITRGKDALKNGNTIVFHNQEIYKSMLEYPCEFTDIKALKYPTKLALPFHKDSPIKDLIEEMLLELHIHGAVQRIWESYQSLVEEKSCDQVVSHQ